MGDILNWNEAEWELSNVKRLDLDTSDFCIDFPEKNYFMIPERRSLESGYDVCHILGTVNQNSEFRYRRSPHFVIFGTKRVSRNLGITNFETLFSTKSKIGSIKFSKVHFFS